VARYSDTIASARAQRGYVHRGFVDEAPRGQQDWFTNFGRQAMALHFISLDTPALL
jgi:hypothetical protein